jgi:hypothetical protein
MSMHAMDVMSCLLFVFFWSQAAWMSVGATALMFFVILLDDSGILLNLEFCV